MGLFRLEFWIWQWRQICRGNTLFEEELEVMSKSKPNNNNGTSSPLGVSKLTRSMAEEDEVEEEDIWTLLLRHKTNSTSTISFPMVIFNHVFCLSNGYRNMIIV